MTPGIYSILNTQNGKRYVGRSKNMEARWRGHERSLVAGSHCNNHLQRSWNLYGSSTFQFEILEVVPDAMTRAHREAFWCGHFDTHNRDKGYNIGDVRTDEGSVYVSDEVRLKRSAARLGKTMSAETRRKISIANKGRKRTSEVCERIRQARTGTKASEETRKKMSVSRRKWNHSPETVAKIADSNRGQKRSPAICQAMSEARKGRPGRPHTAETKAKISEKLQGQKRTPEQCARISVSKQGPRKPHSEETRNKIAASLRAYWARRKSSDIVNNPSCA